MAELKSRYMYMHGRGEWIGVVYTERKTLFGRQTMLLTLGAEPTEAAIKSWLEAAKINKPWESFGRETPDLYDRTK